MSTLSMKYLFLSSFTLGIWVSICIQMSFGLQGYSRLSKESHVVPNQDSHGLVQLKLTTMGSEFGKQYIKPGYVLKGLRESLKKNGIQIYKTRYDEMKESLIESAENLEYALTSILEEDNHSGSVVNIKDKVETNDLSFIPSLFKENEKTEGILERYESVRKVLASTKLPRDFEAIVTLVAKGQPLTTKKSASFHNFIMLDVEVGKYFVLGYQPLFNAEDLRKWALDEVERKHVFSEVIQSEEQAKMVWRFFHHLHQMLDEHVTYLITRSLYNSIPNVKHASRSTSPSKKASKTNLKRVVEGSPILELKNKKDTAYQPLVETHSKNKKRKNSKTKEKEDIDQSKSSSNLSFENKLFQLE